MSTKLYTVVKDGTLEHTGFDKEEAMKIARRESGVDQDMPLGNVDVWESIPGSKGRIIWSVCWESMGPLEPNIFTPSLIPSTI